MTTEQEAPIYLTIDWSTFKKWETITLSYKAIGGDNGIDLIVKYAKKNYGVIVEWLEYDDDIKFIVHDRITNKGFNPSAVENLYNLIKECDENNNYDGAPNSYLRKHCDLSYINFRHAIDFLKAEGRIRSGVEKAGRGRPNIMYFVTNTGE